MRHQELFSFVGHMAQIQIHTENRTPAATSININKHYPQASLPFLYSPLLSFLYHVLDLFAFLLTCTPIFPLNFF